MEELRRYYFRIYFLLCRYAGVSGGVRKRVGLYVHDIPIKYWPKIRVLAYADDTPICLYWMDGKGGGLEVWIGGSVSLPARAPRSTPPLCTTESLGCSYN